MTEDSFKIWLDKLKQSWEHLDPQAAVALFDDNAFYQAGPFERPLEGLPKIQEFWVRAAHAQHDVEFAYEFLGIGPRGGIAHWSARFVRDPSHHKVEADGICVVELNDQGKCTRFREWWKKCETAIQDGGEVVIACD
jgi:hypothetical protein